jgi:hypothetical protein
MTWLEALDALASHSHLERYRFLCFDHPDQETRAAYREHVVRKATGEPPPGPRAIEKPPQRVGGCCGGVPMPAGEQG